MGLCRHLLPLALSGSALDFLSSLPTRGQVAHIQLERAPRGSAWACHLPVQNHLTPQSAPSVCPLCAQKAESSQPSTEGCAVASARWLLEAPLPAPPSRLCFLLFSTLSGCCVSPSFPFPREACRSFTVLTLFSVLFLLVISSLPR